MFRRAALFFWMVFLILSPGFEHFSLEASARRPASSAPDAATESVHWIRAGVNDGFEAKVYGGELFVSIEQLARMSGAQLRWQSVSQQVCLSRATGLLCFNWDRSQISLNGDDTDYNYKIRYESGELLVLLNFVTSRAFERFSQQEFYWNAAKKRLTQEEPITVSLPPIENLGDRYRLAIPIKKGVGYSLLENSSRRMWVRFVRGRTEGSHILEGDEVIKEIRVVQKRKSADLVVVLGPKALSREIYFDNDVGKLTIDVMKPESETAMSHVTKDPPTAPFPSSLAVPPAASARRTDFPAPASDPKIFTVVIDAGHGGVDPGAIGTRGTFEKDINLRAAKYLEEALLKNKNIRVIQTRTKDEFVALADRTEVANRARADVFVSLHCNSSLSARSEGFEVYILSHKATDQAAEAVARIENSVVALESKKGEDSSRLSGLLASMAVNTNINESSRVAGYILRGIKKRTNLQKASYREANFFVLRSDQIPGVLVELGYLSNPVSELQLRSSRYLNQVTRGIADGILMYQQHLAETAKKRG